MGVNNAFYESAGPSWWSEGAGFAYTSLRYCVNPVRYRYFRRVLERQAIRGGRVLDIGCGGGFLSESFAADGFAVSGVDPSANSIRAARDHAAGEGLRIDYRVARGEALPFPDATFDVVACCDVLEHVDDVPQVLAEASRVVVPGGVFLFDTVNRTRKSRFAMITLWQDWNILGLTGADSEGALHVWDRFITPGELSAALADRRLVVQEVRGLSARGNPLALMWAFLRIRMGRVRDEDLASALGFHESGDTGVSYMGWARMSR